MTRPVLADERSSAHPSATVPAAGESPRRRRRGRRRGPSILTLTLFLLPGVVLFGLLVLAPILIAGYASLFNWNGLGGPPTNFIGLDNFTRMLTNDVFLGDLQRGLILVILSVTIQLPLALGLALLLNQRLPGRAMFRVLFFAPYVLSEVITAALFGLVLAPTGGLVNEIFTAVGLGSWAQPWLGSRDLVLYALFVVITWKYFGFHMILYLAGRQNIPKELTEAAATDGATSWQIFRSITLPLLGPTIRITIFLSVIGTIQLFDLVWVMTGGGPVHASETLAVTMFQHGFRRFEVGYASAISIAMFIISLIFALGYQRFVLRRDLEGAVTVLGGGPR